MKKKQTSFPSITAQCIMGHTEVLTAKQLAEAKDIGCAMCSKCGNPMVVKKVKV